MSLKRDLFVALVAALAAFYAAKHVNEQYTLEQLMLWKSMLDTHKEAVPMDPTLYYSAGGTIRQQQVDFGRLIFERREQEFALVADLDRASRDPSEFIFRSKLKKGLLVRLSPDRFEIRWGQTLDLQSHTAMMNRSMELSDLVKYRHLLLASCDITGLVFKIVPKDGRVFQRHALADGDGDEPKPCKIEWATVKDDRVWFGSVGKEILDSRGNLKNRNAEWVKVLDANGHIDNVNWGAVYEALRTATNTTYPGYLWHEAVHWDPRRRVWVFLPRKASTDTPYTDLANERLGSNLLLVASEDFSTINVTTIGRLDIRYGFTAVRKVPGTEHIYIALKVREEGNLTHTLITVFDLDGKFYLEKPFEHVSDLKYEGLDFLS